MKHGSLFSGIGGFDLAAEWMGWENVFHCEINPFCQKVLKYHFPNAESLTDIKLTDFKKYNGSIDIISGGFPCQPYSLAGKRKGKEDERHLWPEMLRAIREIQPGWIVGENVFGLVNWSGGLVFHEVQTNLEAEGYEVFPYVLPACAKDAPHRRDRVWFVAYSANQRLQKPKKSEFKKQLFDAERNNLQYAFADTYGNGCNRSNSEHEINPSERREYALNNFEQIVTPDTHLSRCRESDKEYEGRSSKQSDSNSIQYDVANTGNTRLQRSKINGGIGAIRQNGNEQLAGCIPPNWEKFPTQPPICNGDDGVFTGLDTTAISKSKWRNESIKAGGNAIVPQVAFEIFKSIEQTELNFFS